MSPLLSILTLTGGLVLQTQAPDTSIFGAPFLVTLNGEPVTAEYGYAAPVLADFNGDGRMDLLLGQRCRGSLLIYLNQGTGIEPDFSDPFLFQAAGAEACVPVG